MGTTNTKSISGITASADCSAKQFSLAALTGSRTASFAATAGVKCVGVINNKPALGQAIGIDVGPVVKVRLAATLAAGVPYSTDNTGAARALVTGDYILGQLLEGGAVGDIVSATFEPMGIAP